MTEPQYRDHGFDFHEKWCHLQSGMGGRCTCDSGYLSYDIVNPSLTQVVGTVRARNPEHAVEVAASLNLLPTGNEQYYRHRVLPVPAVSAAERTQAAGRIQRVNASKALEIVAEANLALAEGDYNTSGLVKRLISALADAWDEGLQAGQDRWMDNREFGDKPVNPYRKVSS